MKIYFNALPRNVTYTHMELDFIVSFQIQKNEKFVRLIVRKKLLVRSYTSQVERKPKSWRKKLNRTLLKLYTYNDSS